MLQLLDKFISHRFCRSSCSSFCVTKSRQLSSKQSITCCIYCGFEDFPPFVELFDGFCRSGSEVLCFLVKVITVDVIEEFFAFTENSFCFLAVVLRLVVTLCIVTLLCFVNNLLYIVAVLDNVLCLKVFPRNILVGAPLFKDISVLLTDTVQGFIFAFSFVPLFVQRVGILEQTDALLPLFGNRVFVGLL